MYSRTAEETNDKKEDIVPELSIKFRISRMMSRMMSRISTIMSRIFRIMSFNEVSPDIQWCAILGFLTLILVCIYYILCPSIAFLWNVMTTVISVMSSYIPHHVAEQHGELKNTFSEVTKWTQQRTRREEMDFFRQEFLKQEDMIQSLRSDVKDLRFLLEDATRSMKELQIQMARLIKEYFENQKDMAQLLMSDVHTLKLFKVDAATKLTDLQKELHILKNDGTRMTDKSSDK
ncbi:uncharacterized protein LOC128620056 [Ictalurus furcatus]|uniref:uncharacterized protein LOC128620056 n=1 Tax=Ictalurus furcatus TaxID=66913 RepID=UPI00234FBF31|nr:uncharacterized protein LOC128620056 [Ictalurus furcatus]